MSFTKIRNATSSEKMKSGPTKLWTFFETTVTHEKLEYPSHGSTMCLPQNMTMPVSARKMNEIAIVQCEARSTALKRSMRRPVGGFFSLILPLIT